MTEMRTNSMKKTTYIIGAFVLGAGVAIASSVHGILVADNPKALEQLKQYELPAQPTVIKREQEKQKKFNDSVAITAEIERKNKTLNERIETLEQKVIKLEARLNAIEAEEVYQ